LLVRSPIPFAVVPGQVEERAGVFGEVLDKPAVKVSEPEEGLYLLLVGWGRPLCNARHFDRVHSDGVMGDDDPEVFNCGPFKFALVWPKIELVFF